MYHHLTILFVFLFFTSIGYSQDVQIMRIPSGTYPISSSGGSLPAFCLEKNRSAPTSDFSMKSTFNISISGPTLPGGGGPIDSDDNTWFEFSGTGSPTEITYSSKKEGDYEMVVGAGGGLVAFDSRDLTEYRNIITSRKEILSKYDQFCNEIASSSVILDEEDTESFKLDKLSIEQYTLITDEWWFDFQVNTFVKHYINLLENNYDIQLDKWKVETTDYYRQVLNIPTLGPEDINVDYIGYKDERDQMAILDFLLPTEEEAANLSDEEAFTQMLMLMLVSPERFISNFDVRVSLQEDPFYTTINTLETKIMESQPFRRNTQPEESLEECKPTVEVCANETATEVSFGCSNYGKIHISTDKKIKLSLTNGKDSYQREFGF